MLKQRTASMRSKYMSNLHANAKSRGGAKYYAARFPLYMLSSSLKSISRDSLSARSGLVLARRDSTMERSSSSGTSCCRPLGAPGLRHRGST